MPYDERHMRRAVELAERALGAVSPNPPVGAVLVRDGEIIGEGWTQPPGGPHAEIVALRDAGDASGASLYVTLEPCCHHGRTPPCTDAIIATGVRNVYAGIEDVNPVVRCSGFAQLEAAGLHVERGCLAKEISRQLEAYIIGVCEKRAFVVLKTAATIDGRVAAADGTSRWITGEQARRDVHRLRAASDAVITGVGTVLADDPQLTARNAPCAAQPLRVILDRNLRLPLDAKIADTAAPTLIVTCVGESKKAAALLNAGVEVLSAAPRDDKALLRFTLRALYERGLRQVMIEAGPTLTTSFLRHGLVDRWVAYVAPRLLGAGPSVVGDIGVESMAQARTFVLENVARLGDDVRLDLVRPKES